MPIPNATVAHMMLTCPLLHCRWLYSLSSPMPAWYGTAARPFGNRLSARGFVCSAAATLTQSFCEKQYTIPHATLPFLCVNFSAMMSLISSTVFFPFFRTSYMMFVRLNV